MNVRIFPLLLISVCIAASSCGAVGDKLGDKLGEALLPKLAADVNRTEELAVKYNSPAVAQCAHWLGEALGGFSELQNEPTDGILSSALKAALLKRMGTVSEDLFAQNCGGVAARMLVELGRKAPIPGR